MVSLFFFSLVPVTDSSGGSWSETPFCVGKWYFCLGCGEKRSTLDWNGRSSFPLRLVGFEKWGQSCRWYKQNISMNLPPRLLYDQICHWLEQNRSERVELLQLHVILRTLFAFPQPLGCRGKRMPNVTAKWLVRSMTKPQKLSACRFGGQSGGSYITRSHDRVFFRWANLSQNQSFVYRELLHWDGWRWCQVTVREC